MNELYEIAFSSVNAPYSILLLIIVAYWLLVIIGLLDMNAFDFDLDTDFDADFDVDADAGEIPGLGQQVAGFLNIGEVPVMFYLSIVALSMWVGSVQINRLLENTNNIWIAFALAIPNLVVGLLVAKLVTTPFKWMNVRIDDKNEFEDMSCLVSSLEVTEDHGECEIQQDGTPVKIFARTREGEVLTKGDAAVVVECLKRDENVYIVKKYEREE